MEKYIHEELNTENEEFFINLLQLKRADKTTNRYLTSTYNLYMLQPEGNDKLAENYMTANNIQFIIILSITFLICILPVLLSIIEKTFLNPDLEVDLFHDIGYHNQFFLGIIAIILIIRGYFTNLPFFIFKLISSGSIQMTITEYRLFITDSNMMYRHKISTIFPYFTGLLVTILGRIVYIFSTPNTWNATPAQPNGTIAGWASSLPVFIFYYLIGLVLIRVVYTYFMLRKLFQYKVEIQPLHPDRCGGLSPLGKLSSSLNYGVFIFGIIIVIGVYYSINIMGFPWYHGLHIFSITGYISASVVLFFLPLHAARSKMKKAKFITLKIINDRFNQTNKELLKRIKTGSKLSGEDIENYESIKTLYETAKEMPVYPFDMKTLSSFLGTILFPLIILLLEIFVSNIIAFP